MSTTRQLSKPSAGEQGELYAATSVFVLNQCFFSIFSILDDECNVPKGSDENIAPAIGQLALRLSTGVHWNKDKPLLSVAKIGHDKFSVAHYAGDVRDVCVCVARGVRLTAAWQVQYTTALWLDKNRDALNTDISERLAAPLS
jgi:hypothetical protein